MKILLITPVPSQSRQGNGITAQRWARILRNLGHRVHIAQQYQDQPCDLLIALHARRSFPAIARFHRLHPTTPLVVALTGTDLYGDLPTSREALQSLVLATRLVLLQPRGLAILPAHLRSKAHVIYQSASSPGQPCAKPKRTFDVCVLGHLRVVKDPFRTALAARLLPPRSRIRVLHVGKALSADMAERARKEEACNPRYRWFGELPRWRALRVLARSHLMVLSSTMEGGANAISEAIAASVPILASHIDGSVGILGEDYPGLFPVGDTMALAQLLQCAETDATFYQSLLARCQALAPLVHPAHEHQAWKRLLQELTV